MRESEILEQIKQELELGIHTGCVLWRLSQVVANVDGRTVRGGMRAGAADMIGIVRTENGIGRFIAIELKTEKGRQSKEQIQFENIVQQMGGYYAVCRTVDEVREHIQKARKGES